MGTVLRLEVPSELPTLTKQLHMTATTDHETACFL